MREALAIGAGSGEALLSSGFGGVITGSIVERDSGSRRVRKRVDDCLYILDIWEEFCREEVELEREDIEDVRRVSRVGLRVVVATEPLEVMALTLFVDREPWREKGEGRKELKGRNEVRDTPCPALACYCSRLCCCECER